MRALRVQLEHFLMQVQQVVYHVQLEHMLLQAHLENAHPAQLENILLIQGLSVLQFALLVQLEHILLQLGLLAVVHVYLECFLQ